MIQKGIIRRMGQYYRSNPEYREEIFRGLREFFGFDAVQMENKKEKNLFIKEMSKIKMETPKDAMDFCEKYL